MNASTAKGTARPLSFSAQAVAELLHPFCEAGGAGQQRMSRTWVHSSPALLLGSF